MYFQSRHKLLVYISQYSSAWILRVMVSDCKVQPVTYFGKLQRNQGPLKHCAHLESILSSTWRYTNLPKQYSSIQCMYCDWMRAGSPFSFEAPNTPLEAWVCIERNIQSFCAKIGKSILGMYISKDKRLQNKGIFSCRVKNPRRWRTLPRLL